MNTFQDINGYSGFGSSPDGIGSPDGLGLPPLGATVTAIDEPKPALSRPGVRLYGLIGLAGGALGAYHGYKRNESVGWAIGWAFLGSLVPFITVPVAIAQGFGKRRGSR